jgi:hypothetical protein
MFTLIGIVASAFAAIRVASLWESDAANVAGVMVFVLGAGFCLATEIGAFVAIGATIWLYRNTETSGAEQFDDFDQKSLPDPDDMSHRGGADESVSSDGGEAADEFFDSQARTGGVTPDPAPDDRQRETGPGTSPPTPPEADSSDRGGDDESTDDRDPYDIEW